MAEIFVGEVAVGVVPDLRGFNTKLRNELVPEADRVGRDMGTALTRGMIATLDVGRAFRDASSRGASSVAATADRIGREFGTRVTKVISSSLGIGTAITDSARRGEPQTARAGDRTGKVFADSAKARIQAEFKGESVKVGVNLDTAKARAELAVFKSAARSDVRIGVGRGILDAIRAEFGGGAVAGGGGGSVAPILGGLISGTGGVAGGVIGGRAAGGAVRDIVPRQARAIEAYHATRIFGSVAGAASAAVSGGASGGSGGGGGGLFNMFSALPPQAKAGLIAGAVAAAPFIAQAIGGAVVSGFGLATAGIAIIGAAQSAEVQQTFSDMKDRIKEDFAIIGQSFVPVLESIMNTASQTMDKLTPVFTSAANIISGPFKVFADTVISAFGDPQVQSAITAVANAFADILKAFTPDVKGIVDSVADAIERIAKAIEKNPKAFADFLNFMFQVGIFALNVIAFLTNVAVWIEEHWGPIWDSFKRAVVMALGPIAGMILTHIIPIIRGIVAAVVWVKNNWSKIWDQVKSAAKATWDGIRRIFASFIVDGILRPLGAVLHAAAVAFDGYPVWPDSRPPIRRFEISHGFRQRRSANRRPARSVVG
jgi:hypothetical protein